MFLEIITPDKKLFSGEVTSVQVSGTSGQFTVLNNHAPIISTLDKGKVKVKSPSGEQLFDINGGVIEVFKNKIIVLAE
ncbi:MAG: ATP synthase F1 subunit epsilon [Bacteroidia bacterium]